MSKKTIVILVVTVVVIAALGGAGYLFRDSIASVLPFGQGGNSADKVYVEKVSKVMNQYTGISNRYNGTVESQDTFEVNVDSSRTIDKILVEVGEEVAEGQELVTYDTNDIKMQIEQANLEIESINNDIENYRKQIEALDAERSKAPEADKFSYTTQIQSLENNIRQRGFDLESKQLEITKFRTQINNSTVTSKVAGVVREINEKGVDANGNQAAFMTILQTGEYRIKGRIDEQNIWMVSEGQSVVIRSRVDETQTWDGTISKVDTENTDNNNNNMYYSDSNGESASKYPFYIELETAEGLILGQHVYIEMDEGQEEEKEGLWLYGSYIVQEEDRPYVWAANAKNRLEKRYVELGDYDENLDEYQILSGLTIDDYITWPMPGLYEGVTAVTNAEEVDYSSPLYNQETTENGMMEDGMMTDDGMMNDGMMMEDGMEGVYGTEFNEDGDVENGMESSVTESDGEPEVEE